MEIKVEENSKYVERAEGKISWETEKEDIQHELLERQKMILF